MLEIVAEPLVAGAVLADAYRLERVLGAGGMSVVWAARELTTGRDVAIKLLADDRAADPAQRARVLREAAAAMRIDHPNVVAIAAVLETDSGVPFLVMERLVGEPLRALLERVRVLDVETCRKIFVPVADAIAAAHAAGVVHRDLKPENVFLLDGGGVKVVDFGIAKRIERDVTASTSLTATGAILGTPHYMAPEQVFGDDDIDARADVWSLGIVLYECLAGVRPTEADGFGQILKRITSASFAPLATVRPGLPSQLTDVVDRMLARERAARPSLDTVRAAFDDAPASVARTADPPVRRRRLGLAGGAAAASAVAIGLVVLAVRPRAHRDAEPPAETDPQRYLLAASNDQARMDGAACLRDLDAYDRASRRTLPRSDDLAGGYGGVRATCMMLVGQCSAGKALYTAWLPLHAAPMDAGLYETAAEQIAAIYCRR